MLDICDEHKLGSCPFCIGAVARSTVIEFQQLWANLHLGKETIQQWESRIPAGGCDCKSFYREWRKQNPPPIGDSFEWGVALHNAVSEKLGKPAPSLEQSYHLWRRNKPVHRVRNVPIVSSVSPKKIERQTACIQSWLDSGFHVILIQSAREIERCKELFSLPVEWRTCDTPRPQILEMLHAGAIVNSDCEMRGEGPDFGGDPVGLLRWNYEEGKPCREEEWGIDCWYLPKDALRVIPDDFPFMIGKPFWDYGVPAFLQVNKIQFSIDHKPWLLHESHELNWSDAEWVVGRDYIAGKLNRYNYVTPEFRASIDTLPYNKSLGMFHA